MQDLGRFGGRILVVLANSGLILGPILEPGGRMRSILDQLKKQALKKSPGTPPQGSFYTVSGSILGLFLVLFWHQFLDLVFGGLLAHFLVIFGTVLGPSGPLKSTKNVERWLDFAFLRFSLRLVFGCRFGKHFGGILGPKIEPKSSQK